MKKFMQKAAALCLMLALVAPATVFAQSTTAKKKRASAPAVTAEDLKALREALAAQQEQIEALRQELARRDQANQQSVEALRMAQTQAGEANTKAQAAESAVTQTTTTLDELKTELADVKANQTTAALSTQDDQKRTGAVEALLGRFRPNGDIRLRYENFFQGYAGCAACDPRHRVRIRLRFGFDGKLGENFVGGFGLATGDLVDPVSTNATLTPFFNRKQIAVDKAFLTFAPRDHKWLQLTGGKFPFTWARSTMTFDSDINPEGFSQKLSFDLKNPVIKNVSFSGMQLLVQEVSATQDAFAAGGQFSTKLQLGSRVTMTPNYTILKWRNPNQIARGIASGSYNANRNTNATTGTGLTVNYLSRFLYSNILVDTAIKTNSDRWPIRLVAEYQDNLDVRNSQGQAYGGEFTVGQTRNKNDVQVGYSFYHIEQDAVIGAFVNSDFRAPTNVIQHQLFANWQVQPNVTFGATGFFGRTLNANLQNAARATGLPAGLQDPHLKRFQFDLVYKF